ncbi:MAG: metallophosphoesterase [Acidobacteria bacterium]|nr:metallophosphoesterase [Acidobacteriota bacterium]
MGLSQSFYRNIPDLVILGVVVAMHFVCYRQLAGRHIVRLAIALLGCLAAFSVATGIHPVNRLVEGSDGLYWLRGLGMLYALASLGAYVLYRISRAAQASVAPERREFVKALGTALVAGPAILAGHGFVAGRREFRVEEVDIPIRGVDPSTMRDLNGLRILHLSDSHFSPFFTAEDLERVVAMANETKPHMAVFTGDFITDARNPLEECIRIMAKLKADAPLLACNGNHEIFGKCEVAAQQLGARYGIEILRQQNTELRFGNARVNVAGVDYQQYRKPYLVGAGQHLRPGAYNILLSHNPDVFPVAAEQGYQLTLAGHTHGGQVTVEILNQYANVARFFTPYVSGKYTRENALCYVTRGLGTVGIPARIGAPPEITLIRLCAS